ncbi:MAG: hypothetical protein PHI99_06865 [Syntrophales bacterium]|nr:hypothetical protein [Syntrophales bacterium]
MPEQGDVWGVEEEMIDAAEMEAVIYPVVCDCGFTGFRDECPYGRCPVCQGRVRREE